MESKLNDLKLIIKKCKYTNTYKMAWAKALVVICKIKKNKEKIIEIDFNEMAEIMIQDYWNQTILYNLNQSNDKNVEPTIIQEIKKLIEDYIKLTNREKDSFIDAEEVLKNRLFSKYMTTINNIASTLKKDVSWRFLYLNKENYNLYLLNLRDKKILIDRDFANHISDNYEELLEIIEYRWACILETFNQELNDENIIKTRAKKNKNNFFIKEYSTKENKDLNEKIVLKLGKEWKTIKI